jgi:NitT/TauT family transport system permease protein
VGDIAHRAESDGTAGAAATVGREAAPGGIRWSRMPPGHSEVRRGLRRGAGLLVAFLISFFPIIIDSVVGLRSVEPEMLHLARSMGARETKIFLKIRFPTALPNIFAGLKVAVTLAVVGAIVGEFIQADQGLGYALLQANAVLNTKLGFAAVIVLAAIGVAMFMVVDALERRLIPWHAFRRTL